MEPKYNKVMVLGAGLGQVPLIDYFHTLGKYVIVVSPKGDYPGFDLADEVLYEDVRNKEFILEYAKKKLITAIVTDQLDQGVPTVAYVSEKLGLNTNTFEVSLKFTNKYKMREEASKLGIHVPKYIEAETFERASYLIEENQLKFPLVLKPLDGSASNGIYKVADFSMIKQHFGYAKSFSKVGRVIIEEFIEGKEFVVESYTHNFVPHTLMVGHRDYFSVENSFIPCATVFVDAESANSIIEEDLKKVNETIIRGFGLKFGITHGEYIVEKDTNHVFLVEIAARGGGVFTSSEIIPVVTGIKANQLLIEDSLGLCVRDFKIRKGAGAYFCYMLPEGIVSKIQNFEKVKAIPGVVMCNTSNVSLGMRIKKSRDKYSRKGPIIVSSTTKAGCYSILEQIKQILKIEVTNDLGQVMQCYWQ